MTPKMQDTKAMESYGEILEMTLLDDRQAVLPRMEQAYKDIIKRYPDAYLAQESYWRLVLLHLEQYNPPRVDKADAYYREFLDKYPDSKIKVVLDDTLVRYYHNNGIWDRLLDVTTPYVRKYIDKGVLKTPMFMYFYSEAKFNLGDKAEAKKGYRIVLKHFPGSTEAKLSTKRLKSIAKQTN